MADSDLLVGRHTEKSPEIQCPTVMFERWLPQRSPKGSDFMCEGKCSRRK